MREVVEQLQELSPEALHEKCRRVNSRRALADWQMAACLLACQRTQLYRRHDCSSVVQYAVNLLSMDAQKAGELLRAAEFMEHLSELSEAFRTGRIGWGKVRVLKSVMTPETQEDWLAYALSHSVAELERAVAITPTEWKKRAQEATLNSPKVRLACEGGDLFGDSAVEVPSLPRNGSVPTDPKPSSVKPPTTSESLVDPVTHRTTGPDRVSESGPVPLPPSRPQLVRVTFLFTPEEYVAFEEGRSYMGKLLQKKRLRREAAVVEMARRSLACAPSRTRARHTVIVHVNAETEAAWFETSRGNLPVSGEELTEALTTGTITFADRPQEAPAETEDRTKNEQISPGKRKRPPIPVAILRQLYARAGGCCEMPGCGNRQNLQAHHRRAWSRGGTHDLDCLELRCLACHGVTHEEDFRKEPTWRRARATRRKKRSAPGG